MLTLSLFPHYSIFRATVGPRLAAPLGSGAMQLRRRYQRVLYRFTVHDAQATKASAADFYSFVALHQGDTPFWWDGGEFGIRSDPELFGDGDGTRKQFFLPNRNITGALLTYTGGVLDSPQPTLDGSTGLVTYAAGPTGALTATYTCRYKLVVWPQGDEVLLNAENFAKALHRYDSVVFQEIVP